MEERRVGKMAAVKITKKMNNTYLFFYAIFASQSDNPADTRAAYAQ